MGEEKMSMGADASFTVRRAGKVIDERRVMQDHEVDPEQARIVEKLIELLNKKEE